jgi:hypothetical protein
MRQHRTIRKGAIRALALLAACAALAVLPVLAIAHGGSEARAQRPQFDTGSLRLSGKGGYGTELGHRQIRVTVCLRKRVSGQFFNVRCQTDYDVDRRVSARVSVPGCVEGVWRTTALGEALGRGGEWRHTAFDVSRPLRCP